MTHLLLLLLPFGVSDSTMKNEISLFGDVGVSIQSVGSPNFLTGFDFSFGGIKPITKDFGILNHKIQATLSIVDYSTISLFFSDEENSKIIENNKKTGYVFGLDYGFYWYKSEHSISPYVEIGTGFNYVIIPEWTQKRRSFWTQEEYISEIYPSRNEFLPLLYSGIGLVQFIHEKYSATVGLKSVFTYRNNTKLMLYIGFYWS